MSTDYVFAGDKPPGLPYREDDPVGPICWYGRTKLMGEEGVRQELDDHLIVRTAWLYGLNGRNFLKTMLRLALERQDEPIRVVNDQYGALTWTRTLAQQLAVLAECGLRGTVHATAEGYCTWYQGAKRFLEELGVVHRLQPCPTSAYPTPAVRPRNSILENHRLKAHGLNRMRPWDEDVAAFARMHGRELLQEARSRS